MRLVIDGLAGERGDRILFSGLSADLGEGSALLVTGPNGSGKSTFLRIVAGLLPASAGSISLQDAAPAFSDVPSACHFLGDSDALKPSMTVRQNLQFWAGFQQRAAMTPHDALAAVDLPDIGELPVEALSKGMRRRVAFARLLQVDLPIWLLDEPTSGLDAGATVRVEEQIARHRAEGGIVILASHHAIHMNDVKRIDLGEGGEFLMPTRNHP